MIEAYKRFFRNYTNFSGRSTRSDYWYVVLANIIVSLIIGVVDGILGLSESTITLTTIYSLATLIPGLAIIIRRLHDINKSGWWYLICLAPLVGFIIMLVFLCTDSVNENNKYGERSM